MRTDSLLLRGHVWELIQPIRWATCYAASDVDILLAEAWRSGVNSWSTSTRQSFANDLTRPRLIAVTDNVNQSKGDTRTVGLAAAAVVVPVHLQQAVDHGEVQLGLKLQSAEKTAL